MRIWMIGALCLALVSAGCATSEKDVKPPSPIGAPQGLDKQAAINAEADVVARYRDMAVLDGNVAPEQYARLQARVDGERAVLLVNGAEIFLRKAFERSGGQVQMLLYLERRDG